MLNLNQSAIERANSASQFDAGSTLAAEAERVYAAGLQKMRPEGAELNERQAAILAERLEGWKDLVEKAYNDIIARRASWMPWTVCGPARYNSRRNSARADAQMNAVAEWNGKMDRYIENTAAMIRDAIPRAELLAQYRSGKRRDAISSDDPDAAEKLAARIEGMKERHALAVKQNAYYRKHGTMRGFPGVSDERAARWDAEIAAAPPFARAPWPAFHLSNDTANIKRLQDRLDGLRKREQARPAAFTLSCEPFGVALEDGRINISFDGKPEEAAREILKKNGFHWSPRAKVWTRKDTANARYALKHYALPALRALPEYAPEKMTLAEFAAAARSARPTPAE